MGAHWPFHLPGDLPLPILPHQRQICSSQGISSFVAFTSTSARWVEWSPVDESDLSSAQTSRGEPGVQGLRYADSSGGNRGSKRLGVDQRPEPWMISATSSPTTSSCPC